jgi:hypothetical protein
MSLIQGLAGAVAPWQSLNSRSLAVSTTVTTLHIVSLLLSGGLAIAADRTTLRVLRKPMAERATALAELSAVHRPVLLALALLMASGLLLAAADVEAFAGSPLFWIKMALVALLLANGAGLHRAERRLAAAGEGLDPVRTWHGAGRRARVSLALWLVVAVLGTVLTSVG